MSCVLWFMFWVLCPVVYILFSSSLVLPLMFSVMYTVSCIFFPLLNFICHVLHFLCLVLLCMVFCIFCPATCVSLSILGKTALNKIPVVRKSWLFSLMLLSKQRCFPCFPHWFAQCVFTSMLNLAFLI